MFVANFDAYSIAKFETTYADMEVMRKGNWNDRVNDWYAKDYYQHTPEHNPQGPGSGTEKVQRDGSGVTMTFSRLHSSDYDRYRVGVSFRCAVQQTASVML